MSAVGIDNSLVTLLVEQLADRIVKSVHDKMAEPRLVEKQLYSVAEAAVYLGRTAGAIRHLIDDRELPVIRVGTRIHIARADMDAWIERNRV